MCVEDGAESQYSGSSLSLVQELNEEVIGDVLGSLQYATEAAQGWAKAWHNWALFNVQVSHWLCKISWLLSMAADNANESATPASLLVYKRVIMTSCFITLCTIVHALYTKAATWISAFATTHDSSAAAGNICRLLAAAPVPAPSTDEA